MTATTPSPDAAPTRQVIWVNGTFGAGKTTTVAHLLDTIDGAHVFDSEIVGGMLRSVLSYRPVIDFQDYPAWRHLVPHTAAQILDYVGGTLVIPQTVLVEQYWKELGAGFDALDLTVHHVVLHSDRDTLTRRIDNDTVESGARQWRLNHLDAYDEALPWLRTAAHVIDTTKRTPTETVHEIMSTIS